MALVTPGAMECAPVLPHWHPTVQGGHARVTPTPPCAASAAQMQLDSSEPLERRVGPGRSES